MIFLPIDLHHLIVEFNLYPILKGFQIADYT